MSIGIITKHVYGMVVDGFQYSAYWNLSKLVLLGERFRRNNWISYQLFAQNSHNSEKMLGLLMGYILGTEGYTNL